MTAVATDTQLDVIREATSKLTFKPGYQFDWEIHGGVPGLVVTAFLMDAGDPLHVDLFRTEFPVDEQHPLPTTTAELTAFVKAAIAAHDEHECDEWLRWKDGKVPVNDPHPPGWVARTSWGWGTNGNACKHDEPPQVSAWASLP